MIFPGTACPLGARPAAAQQELGHVDPFTVSIHAGFSEDGVWVIEARLEFRDGVPQTGDQRLGKGRLAHLVEIMREGRRGRSLGATKANSHLNDGRPCQKPRLASRF